MMMIGVCVPFLCNPYNKMGYIAFVMGVILDCRVLMVIRKGSRNLIFVYLTVKRFSK